MKQRSAVTLEDIAGTDKYIVIKRAEVEALPLEAQGHFNEALRQIGIMRFSIEGKSEPNKYWVVNHDEPYANLVKALIFDVELPDAGKVQYGLTILIGLRKQEELKLHFANERKNYVDQLNAEKRMAEIEGAINQYKAMMRLVFGKAVPL